jgi:uncharacterized protein (DUF1697 family)
MARDLPPPTHVALLRGINVGGSNVITMVRLAAVLTDAGLEGVRTCIQSGNVLLSSREPAAALERRIERALAAHLRGPALAVVCSRRELRAIVDGAPPGFGSDPGAYRSYLLFCKRPLTGKRALASVTPKPGVDESAAGARVVYFATLRARATASALPRIVGTPMYKQLTIRNWNTTVKLLALLGEPATSSPPRRPPRPRS